MNEIPFLYKKHFVDKKDERNILFDLLKKRFNPIKGLYAGSFVHIAPSLFIEDMTYIDNDKRINQFFQDPLVNLFVEDCKQYKEKQKITHFQADFTQKLPLAEHSFDMLFSFYSGFISQHCKKYLKPNGVLVVNNSHGDASIAYTDQDYHLIGIITRNGDHFKLKEHDLDIYFKKKDGSDINTERVLKRMIGEQFTKTGFAYVFSKK